MPDFLVRVRKWLHEFPESVKTHGLRILGRLMKGAQCLDLSAFHWLPEEVIIKLVKENADVDIDRSGVTGCGEQEVADVMGPFMAKYNEIMRERKTTRN